MIRDLERSLSVVSGRSCGPTCTLCSLYLKTEGKLYLRLIDINILATFSIFYFNVFSTDFKKMQQTFLSSVLM